MPLKSIVTVQCPSMINTQNEQSNIPSAYVLELNHMDQNIKEFDCLRLYVWMSSSSRMYATVSVVVVVAVVVWCGVV